MSFGEKKTSSLLVTFPSAWHLEMSSRSYEKKLGQKRCINSQLMRVPKCSFSHALIVNQRQGLVSERSPFLLLAAAARQANKQPSAWFVSYPGKRRNGFWSRCGSRRAGAGRAAAAVGCCPRLPPGPAASDTPSGRSCPSRCREPAARGESESCHACSAPLVCCASVLCSTLGDTGAEQPVTYSSATIPFATC